MFHSTFLINYNLSLVAGQDYMLPESVIKLDNRTCFNVEIRNDLIIEDIEQFTLNLNSDYWNGTVTFIEDKIVISINDTDGEYISACKCWHGLLISNHFMKNFL